MVVEGAFVMRMVRALLQRGHLRDLWRARTEA